MRYILAIALIVTACTRANPDATGGNGGSGGGGAAGSGGTGGGAGGGGGTGGTGGTGGGSGGELDMSMMPEDMRAVPPDMASLDGVACGNMSCKQTDCCINSSGAHCVSPQQGCTNGPLFMCDGPEDCATGNLAPDCCLQTSNGGMGGTHISGSGCMLPNDPGCAAILCHSLSDCPTLGGYVGCCAGLTGVPYRHCSKTACM
jgi:hypothetical protein